MFRHGDLSDQYDDNNLLRLLNRRCFLNREFEGSKLFSIGSFPVQGWAKPTHDFHDNRTATGSALSFSERALFRTRVVFVRE
jgi:hypothetical protein